MTAHRPASTTTLLLVLLILAVLLGLGAAYVGFRRAAIERDRARQAEMVATESRMRAEHEARKAEQVGAFLRETLVAAEPSSKGQVGVKEALDAASRKLDEGQMKDQPEVRASLHAALGQAYRNHGDLDAAEKHLRAALDLAIQSMGPDHTAVARHREALDELLKAKANQ